MSIESPTRGRRLLRRPGRLTAMVSAPVLISAGIVGVTSGASAKDEVEVVASSITADNGKVFTVTNHLVKDTEDITAAKNALVKSAIDGTNKDAQKIVTKDGRIRHEYLVVWAGDWNAADNHSGSLVKTNPSVNPVTLPDTARDNSVAPDFLAVIDATKGSPTYGKVVNTATTGPIVENEPHHMQYLYHKGDSIFAGGLYSDITYVFDVKKLPQISLKGVNLPTDTPCGSIPDAFWTLKDGTAYGTYMGGADVAGPCVYSDGQVRISNGFGGSPGSIVHMDANGKTLSEVPAALATAEDPVRCVNYPALPLATCANPHGVQAREDLNRLIASDYAEPRNIVLDPVRPENEHVFRDTVRIFDISNRDKAKLVSVSAMPDGPRKERNPSHEEPRGIMETTVTNLPNHKGAFASSMCGGVIYYTPDLTDPSPKWREVWDVTTSTRSLQPQVGEGGGCMGSGWVQTSPDDKYLYQAVIGRGPGATGPTDNGGAKQVYMLDIRKLLAAGADTTCSIDTIQEVTHGGAEADCPTLSDAYKVEDNTSGGPHWGTPDNLQIGKDGYYHEVYDDVKRLAFANYFVARTNTDGNHRVCILDIRRGKLQADPTFVDENEGTPCVSFNRTSWPHGDFGDAKPHSMLFVAADEDLK